MAEFFKKLREKLSVDNIVGLMKDAKVIDEDMVKEKDVRETLSKMDINRYVDLDDLSDKVNQAAEQSKKVVEDLGTVVVEAARSTAKITLSVLTKPTQSASSSDQEKRKPDEERCDDEVYFTYKNYKDFHEFKSDYNHYKDFKD